MTITIVAAVARNGVIGRDNGLPWNLPADRRHFRRLTLGKPIVMGRRTWESLPRALDGRLNIVISRRPGYEAAGATVVPSLEAALEAAGPADEVMIVGGAQVYAEALPRADRIEWTEVEADVEGDVSFPEFDRTLWEERRSVRVEAGPDCELPIRFVALVRKRG